MLSPGDCGCVCVCAHYWSVLRLNSMLFIMPAARWAPADCIIGIRPCAYKYVCFYLSIHLSLRAMCYKKKCYREHFFHIIWYWYISQHKSLFLLRLKTPLKLKSVLTDLEAKKKKRPKKVKLKLCLQLQSSYTGSARLAFFVFNHTYPIPSLLPL